MRWTQFMYTRSNVHPEKPGFWQSDDGEYEFVRAGNVWQIHRTDSYLCHNDSLIGSAATLDAAFRLAARHYVTPMGQWSITHV